MRGLLFLILILLINLCYGQQRECICKTDSLINEFTTDCKAIFLNNGAKLYWQFNCDSIWLTLENKGGKKTVIDNVPTKLYGYKYRLGYHLSKEYKKTLLFRSGCPANGPCNFVLIDKNTGKKLNQFGQLIYENETFYDFVLYIPDSKEYFMIIHYIDTGKKFEIPLDRKKFDGIIPEHQFNKIALNNDTLRLTYEYDQSTKKVTEEMVIDLKKYKP